ncbi:MAG: hypothetical protein R3E60_06905 [Alphaproteobacteria bacterium]
MIRRLGISTGVFSFVMAVAGAAWAHGYGEGLLSFVLIMLLLPPLFGMGVGFLIGMVTNLSILCVGLGALAGIVADLIALFLLWSL